MELREPLLGEANTSSTPQSTSVLKDEQSTSVLKTSSFERTSTSQGIHDTLSPPNDLSQSLSSEKVTKTKLSLKPNECDERPSSSSSSLSSSNQSRAGMSGEVSPSSNKSSRIHPIERNGISNQNSSKPVEKKTSNVAVDLPTKTQYIKEVCCVNATTETPPAQLVVTFSNHTISDSLSGDDSCKNRNNQQRCETSNNNGVSIGEEDDSCSHSSHNHSYNPQKCEKVNNGACELDEECAANGSISYTTNNSCEGSYCGCCYDETCFHGCNTTQERTPPVYPERIRSPYHSHPTARTQNDPLVNSNDVCGVDSKQINRAKRKNKKNKATVATQTLNTINALQSTVNENSQTAPVMSSSEGTQSSNSSTSRVVKCTPNICRQSIDSSRPQYGLLGDMHPSQTTEPLSLTQEVPDVSL